MRGSTHLLPERTQTGLVELATLRLARHVSKVLYCDTSHVWQPKSEAPPAHRV
jgi:hypothetical protein